MNLMNEFREMMELLSTFDVEIELLNETELMQSHYARSFLLFTFDTLQKKNCIV